MFRLILAGLACLFVAALYGTSPKAPDPLPIVIEEPTPAVGQEPQPIAITTVAAPAQRSEAVHPERVPGADCSDCGKNPCVCDRAKASGCNGDCCKCDPSKINYYWHSGKWHPCKVMTREEAEQANERLKERVKPRVTPPYVATSAPVASDSYMRRCVSCLRQIGEDARYCPHCGASNPPPCIVPTRSTAAVPQPVYTMPVFQSGGCANGQCGTSGYQRRGWFGRR